MQEKGNPDYRVRHMIHWGTIGMMSVGFIIGFAGMTLYLAIRKAGKERKANMKGRRTKL